MSVIGSNLIAGASGQGGGYNLTNSLRFRSSASAYLNRTPASASNRKTWTWSGWVKIGKDATTAQYIFAGNSAATDAGFLGFGFTNAATNFVVTGWNTNWKITTQVFRDFSAWYHIVVVLDTTQATANDRIKIYVNGVQVTSFSTTNNPTQNADLGVNTAAAHYFSSYNGINEMFDGYLDEVHFIDGQALTPSSFGAFSATTGVWQPIKYAGTYGTNGFYLPFTDNSALTTSSNVGLGRDYSGNGNYWTTNNISITAGATFDSMTDVPTLTSATTANYCVLNPLQNFNNTISNANLTAVLLGWLGGSNPDSNISGTIATNSGKYYWEHTISAATSNGCQLGVARPEDGNNIFNSSGVYYAASGSKIIDGASTSYGATYTTNDVIGLALDIGAGTVTFYKNNTSQGAITLPSSTNGWKPKIGNTATTGNPFTVNINFGQRPFAYTPPTGFVALNTFNLPTPTIGATASTLANKNFDVNIYTGNGADPRQITNSGSMQPDLVWIKARGSSTLSDHVLDDSVRGATKDLFSNLTAAEGANNSVRSFNTNGFSVGDSTRVNQNSIAYVGWQWRANGAAVTNTAGTISSQVSANTSAGCSVVTYTGTGTTGTIGHGLGVAPSMIITKNRAAGGTAWIVYHAALGATKGIFLESTSAASTTVGFWNNTAPTSSVFTVYGGNDSNTSGNATLAYCFSPVAGYSAFGSYTGNGSTDGTFVYTGFRPRFVMVKATVTAGGSWVIQDTSRNIYNAAPNRLFPNTSDAEGTSSAGDIDILSNGFKLRNTSGSWNTNGETYIYMAFAETPQKFALGR
jgi:hypothetical protein